MKILIIALMMSLLMAVSGFAQETYSVMGFGYGYDSDEHHGEAYFAGIGSRVSDRIFTIVSAELTVENESTVKSYGPQNVWGYIQSDKLAFLGSLAWQILEIDSIGTKTSYMQLAGGIGWFPLGGLIALEEGETRSGILEHFIPGLTLNFHYTPGKSDWYLVGLVTLSFGS